MMQCVQEDRSNPRPCSTEDKARFGEDGTVNPYLAVPAPSAAGAGSAHPSAGSEADDLMKEMMGDKKPGDDADKAKREADDLMREMMGGSPSATPSAGPSAGASAKPVDPNEELMREMMGDKKK